MNLKLFVIRFVFFVILMLLRPELNQIILFLNIIMVVLVLMMLLVLL